MLMKKLRDTFLGMTSEINPTAPVSIVPGQRAAANAADINEAAMLTRSRRRARRAVQTTPIIGGGWTIGSW